MVCIIEYCPYTLGGTGKLSAVRTALEVLTHSKSSVLEKVKGMRWIGGNLKFKSGCVVITKNTGINYFLPHSQAFYSCTFKGTQTAEEIAVKHLHTFRTIF